MAVNSNATGLLVIGLYITLASLSVDMPPLLTLDLGATLSALKGKEPSHSRLNLCVQIFLGIAQLWTNQTRPLHATKTKFLTMLA